MSRHFGAVCQNGYVVRDIEAAMAHWIDALCWALVLYQASQDGLLPAPRTRNGA